MLGAILLSLRGLGSRSELDLGITDLAPSGGGTGKISPRLLLLIRSLREPASSFTLSLCHRLYFSHVTGKTLPIQCSVWTQQDNSQHVGLVQKCLLQGNQLSTSDFPDYPLVLVWVFFYVSGCIRIPLSRAVIPRPKPNQSTVTWSAQGTNWRKRDVAERKVKDRDKNGKWGQAK
ncbi:hypothetical protein C7212DRAFT_308164 [Tuber magnatum]|uniref:Uncharacterized protein n=1 Tax=Tuber magnatum TaxID=42249 RepID=A0A317T045_9PEZI|nr:hypothetical protein C7212DRAFT_308161 [Tuber magnatum]PWW80045.1 hypothetical protein C7212DRAFT_308164 [Tuber magnatum]